MMMATLDRNPQGAGQRPALVIIDASRAFTEPESALGLDGTDVVHAISQLLDAFRARGLPVFFTTVAYDSANQARVFRDRLPALDVLQAGSRWVQIDARLQPQEGEAVLVKHYPSGFFGTELARLLRGKGVDTVHVTGLTTSGCVRATVVDALSYEFRVLVPREAVADRDADAHEANLHDIDCKYGDVVTLQEALSTLD